MFYLFCGGLFDTGQTYGSDALLTLWPKKCLRQWGSKTVIIFYYSAFIIPSLFHWVLYESEVSLSYRRRLISIIRAASQFNRQHLITLMCESHCLYVWSVFTVGLGFVCLWAPSLKAQWKKTTKAKATPYDSKLFHFLHYTSNQLQSTAVFLYHAILGWIKWKGGGKKEVKLNVIASIAKGFNMLESVWVMTFMQLCISSMAEASSRTINSPSKVKKISQKNLEKAFLMCLPAPYNQIWTALSRGIYYTGYWLLLFSTTILLLPDDQSISLLAVRSTDHILWGLGDPN